MSEPVTPTLEVLIEQLKGSQRRLRQEAAHEVFLRTKEDPQALAPFIKDLVSALAAPEAHTRWEILDALTLLLDVDTRTAAGAFNAAEHALFDDLSSAVRLSAFLYLCRLANVSTKRSESVWPLLDEAIQCYHGDPEYRDMLSALLRMAQGTLSKNVKQALVERVQFDSENATGYIKSYSAQIVALLS